MAKSGVSMKWRFPAEAWPGDPGRKPCSASSACRSLAASAIRAGGTQTSSTISAVPGRPQPADQPVQALADPPVDLDRLGVAGELGLADQLVARRAPRRPRASPRRARRRRRRRTRPAAPPTTGRAPSSTRGCRGSSWRRRSAPARPSARPRSRRRRRARRPARSPRRRSAKWIQESVVRARLRDGLEHGLGDERERALGADEQAAEDLERRLGVEERAEAVAGRVLDLELAPDPLAELGVGADLVADLEQAGGELGLGGGEALARRRRRRCRSPFPTASTNVSSRTVE